MKTVKYGRAVVAQHPLAQSGVPNEIPDGQPVEVWHDPFGRQVGKTDDITQGATQVVDVSPAVANFIKVEHSPLTAPGDTPTTEIVDYEYVTYQLDVSSIDTNITGKLEQSMDDELFFDSKLDNDAVENMSLTNNIVIISATGSYGLIARRQGQYSKFSYNSLGNSTMVPTVLAGR